MNEELKGELNVARKVEGEAVLRVPKFMQQPKEVKMTAAQKKHEVLGKLMMASKALEQEHISSEAFGQNGLFAASLVKDAIQLIVELELDEVKLVTA